MALISHEDIHHNDAVGLIDGLHGEAWASPYSLMELDLLLKSGKIIVRDVLAFYDALGELLKYRELDMHPIKPEYHREAFRLRGENKTLTYFDSLHAAVAIVEDLELVSYDSIYSKIQGLKYSHPKNYIGIKH
ncbi:PIN domain-containing protein [Candidatus Bathyarchaeota archaeon]|nr:PIN domain-containing protein [Candidatus Bathyarchaeota archaeon]